MGVVVVTVMGHSELEYCEGTQRYQRDVIDIKQVVLEWTSLAHLAMSSVWHSCLSCMLTWMGWLDPSKNFFLNDTHSSALPLDEPSSVFRKERVAWCCHVGPKAAGEPELPRGTGGQPVCAGLLNNTGMS